MEKAPSENLPEKHLTASGKPESGMPETPKLQCGTSPLDESGGLKAAAQEPDAATGGLTREDVAAMIRTREAGEYSETGLPETHGAPAAAGGALRTLCSELVEVEWVTGASHAARATANLEEIWRTGATLEMETPVTEGTLLTIVRPPVRLAAKVLYCHQNLTGFGVGVQFISGSHWSPKHFMPGHALDLGEIVQSAGGNPSRDGDGDTGDADARPLTPEERLEADLLRDLPPTARGLRGRGKVMLEDLAPLIARGSLVKLRAQMTAGKA